MSTLAERKVLRCFRVSFLALLLLASACAGIPDDATDALPVTAAARPVDVMASHVVEVDGAARSVILLSEDDGFGWFVARRSDLYVCEVGILACETFGRVAAMYCRCARD